MVAALCKSAGVEFVVRRDGIVVDEPPEADAPATPRERFCSALAAKIRRARIKLLAVLRMGKRFELASGERLARHRTSRQRRPLHRAAATGAIGRRQRARDKSKQAGTSKERPPLR